TIRDPAAVVSRIISPPTAPVPRDCISRIRTSASKSPETDLRSHQSLSEAAVPTPPVCDTSQHPSESTLLPPVTPLPIAEPLKPAAERVVAVAVLVTFTVASPESDESPSEMVYDITALPRKPAAGMKR